MKSEDKEFDINGMVFWSGAYAYGAPALSDEVESVYQFFQREGLKGNHQAGSKSWKWNSLADTTANGRIVSNNEKQYNPPYR